MNFLNIIRLAIRAIARNPLRSVLTGLGIVIGVGAVISLVSIGNGAKGQIEDEIDKLGTNLLVVFPGNSRAGGVSSGWGGRRSLKPEDAEAIARDIPHVVATSAEARSRSQILTAGRNWNTTILGESPDFAELRDWPVESGAMFTTDDVQRVAKVAVIGQTILTELFPNGANPIGQIARVGQVPFRIIGVLASKGFNVSGQDQDDVVIIPYTSHLRRISRREYVNSILVQVSDTQFIGSVKQEIADLLSTRHGLIRGESPDFTLRSQLDVVERATATTRTMTLLLGSVACVALLVAGLGIMNIMLVSVTERTHEIGIRLAVGAYGSDVLRQFLCEAVIMSLMGGFVGVAGGVLLAQLVSSLSGWPVVVSSSSVWVSLGFCAVIGIFFGYYPARRAARLDPIEALRYE